jgi:hypothetical protein
VASLVNAGAAAADGRSTFLVHRGVFMAPCLAVIPMLGASLWSWQVDFESDSPSIASPSIVPSNDR